MRKKIQVFTNKTGTGTSPEVQTKSLFAGHAVSVPVMAKFAMTIGATPTITIKLQGFSLASNGWIDLATATKTIAGTYYLVADILKKCHRYRLNITANTNVTVTSAYIGVGSVQA